MKFNFNFYTHLLSYRTLSYDDVGQNEFILFLASELDMYGFSCCTDDYGNLIADRGGDVPKPMIIAHVDINQGDSRVPSFHLVDGWVVGIRDGQQVGCGHDDRAGVYFALLFAEFTDLPCRIIFSKDEEVGCIGTSALPFWALQDITMAVQLDRRGKSDISDFTNSVDVVSPAFKVKTAKVLKKYGYDWKRTLYTDVGALKSNHLVDFCCMNISCGYYDEHTDSERLNVAQFQNAVNFAAELLHNFGSEFQMHKYVAPKFTWTPKKVRPAEKDISSHSYGYGYGKGYDSLWNDDEWDKEWNDRYFGTKKDTKW